MGDKYVVDTHALVWYFAANSRLSQKAKSIMDAGDSELVISIIVLAEAAILIERGRVEISDFEEMFEDIKKDPRIEIHELTQGIFERSLTEAAMKIPEMHDRFIVATGLYLQDLEHNVTVLTRDESITDAQVLPVLW